MSLKWAFPLIGINAVLLVLLASSGFRGWINSEFGTLAPHAWVALWLLVAFLFLLSIYPITGPAVEEEEKAESTEEFLDRVQEVLENLDSTESATFVAPAGIDGDISARDLSDRLERKVSAVINDNQIEFIIV